MGTAIMEAISSIFSLIPSVFTEVTKIFWTAGDSDGTGKLTFVGTICLISLGIALVLWGFRAIAGFMRSGKK